MELFLVQIAKNALLAPESLFGPKSAFWAQIHFWRQKLLLGGNCDFEQKVHFGDLTNSHTGSQICNLATMAPKK